MGKYPRYFAAAPADKNLKREARTVVTAKMTPVAIALVKYNIPLISVDRSSADAPA